MKPIVLITLLSLTICGFGQHQHLISLNEPNPKASSVPAPEKALAPALNESEVSSWLHTFQQFSRGHHLKINSLMVILGDEGAVLHSENPEILRMVFPFQKLALPNQFRWKNDTWLLAVGEQADTTRRYFTGQLGGMEVQAWCRLVTWKGVQAILLEIEQ